jgi:4-hydroxy-3-methylbut-2-enyl diphosphate reductase
MTSTLPPLTILLAQPRGFCAGVVRAIEIVERALEKYGAPIYVRHEIVHNRHVVESLKAKGVVFVKEVEEIPAGGITIFSAHGISEKVENEAKLRDLPAIDATCPLVTKVHNEAKRYEKEGRELVLIGHAGHPEVEGTMGRVKTRVHLVSTIEDVAALEIPATTLLAYVTQTTLSVDDTKDVLAALQQKYPDIQGPDMRDICYATQNRQNAVKDLAKQVQLVVVLGAQNSSNSNRLRDVGEEFGVPSYLINDATEFNPAWLGDNVTHLGITAGASAPEVLVEQLIHSLSAWRDVNVKLLEGVEENVIFKLPPELMRAS